MSPLYQLHEVERRFSLGGNQVHALRALSLDIDVGEFVSIEGPSGSGKSTLLQLLGALDTPSAGTVTFDGKELGQASDAELTTLRSGEIGFVFQQFNLIPTLTAAENVALAMIPQKVSRTDRHARAVDLLEQVGLGHRVEHLPSRMSGGEQQRVAIARALANRPKVIVADEPTGNLDSDSAGDIMDVLDHLMDAGEVTVVVATHDPEVARHARRRIRLRDGRILDDGAAVTGVRSSVGAPTTAVADRPVAGITAVVLADSDGNISFWSPGASELFGHTSADALGAALDIIVPEELRTRHWDGFHRAWREGMHDQERVAMIPVRCADGQVRHFPGRFSAVCGPHGELAALMGVWSEPADGDDELFVLS